MLTTRLHEPADRAAVLDLIGDPRAVDQPQHRVYVAEEAGRVVGTAVVAHALGDTAYLGAVEVAPPFRPDVFRALVLAVAEGAAAAGYRHGVARYIDRSAMVRSRRHVGLTPIVAGRDPATGAAVAWRFEVELPDFVHYLRSRP